MERPSHHVLKYVISQKTHLTGKNLNFFYFLKLNKLSSMAICPKKVRKTRMSTSKSFKATRQQSLVAHPHLTFGDKP